MPVAYASVMFSSLRDELVGRMEAKAAAREAATESACLEVQEALTEELEERLRKHWPRKGRTEVRALCDLVDSKGCWSGASRDERHVHMCVQAKALLSR